jgi:hypothetical protein
MEMTDSFSFFPSNQVPAPSYGAAIYAHPSDVTNDPKLTTAEKRAVLASWISDVRAVEDAPSLRRLDSGAVVEVDAIVQALVSLDELGPDRTGDSKQLDPSGRKRNVVSRWLKRISAPSGSNDDDDDDPPPAPAGLGIPFRPTFVAAHERAAKEGPELLGAAGRMMGAKVFIPSPSYREASQLHGRETVVACCGWKSSHPQRVSEVRAHASFVFGLASALSMCARVPIRWRPKREAPRRAGIAPAPIRFSPFLPMDGTFSIR